jgi:hypothetical protein
MPTREFYFDLPQYDKKSFIQNKIFSFSGEYFPLYRGKSATYQRGYNRQVSLRW